jgi:hypothetical protein
VLKVLKVLKEDLLVPKELQVLKVHKEVQVLRVV